MILGFSTGSMYQTVPSASREIVDICSSLGCNAIEIYPASIDETMELEKNMEDMKDGLSKFEYVSLHSPGIDVMFGNNEEALKVLEIFQRAYDIFRCRHLIVHPDKVEDWSVFRKFHFDILVENMSGDSSFSTPSEIRPILESDPAYHMVLDVNHSYKTSNPPELTVELAETFKEKIKEIHLSGYGGEKALHEPLFKTGQLDIIRSVPDKNLPIIIESGCGTPGEMSAEYEFVRKYLFPAQ